VEVYGDALWAEIVKRFIDDIIPLPEIAAKTKTQLAKEEIAAKTKTQLAKEESSLVASWKSASVCLLRTGCSTSLP
jgi:hypothetical protein